MKKLLSILLSVFVSLFLISFAANAKASENRSVESSSTPEVSSATVDGEAVEYTIMSFEKAKEKQNDQVATYLINAKNELETTKIKKSEAIDYKKIDSSLDSELTKIAKEIDKSYTSQVFVPVQIFELSVESGVLTGDNKVKFVFDLEATEGKYTVIHKNTTTNKWLVVPKEDVKVENGKLAVSFSNLCPVAFLTVNPDVQVEAPAPNVFTYVLIGVSAGLLVLGVVLIFTSKKNRKNK